MIKFEDVKRDAIQLDWPELTEVMQEIYDDTSIVVDQEDGDYISVYSERDDTNYDADDFIERLENYFDVSVITHYVISSEVVVFLYINLTEQP
jgi:hypothetical protein